MANYQAPGREQPGLPGGQSAPEPAIITRTNDPLQLLANILDVAGSLAAQWGEETHLHLRVAALWSRIGRRTKAESYLTFISDQIIRDAYNLGDAGNAYRLDCIRFFYALIGATDGAERLQDSIERSRPGGKVTSWLRSKGLAKYVPGVDESTSLLTTDEEQEIREILTPKRTWLEEVNLTGVPGDCRPVLAHQIRAIREYDEPAVIEQQLFHLFDQCRSWHERQSDTPIWVHDLDDIGPRAMFLAVIARRPNVITTYIERCIDALNERPLALLPNVSTAIGGLVHMARDARRDDLLQRALEFLTRLPEHERCISALTLVQVLVERPSVGSKLI
jgi:hypothetical protein